MQVQKGGLYRVGDELVDANGKPAKQQEAAAQEGTSPPADPTAIPAAFPHAGLLAKGGIKTRAQLAGLNKAALVALDGIGDAKADEILAARAKLDAQA